MTKISACIFDAYGTLFDFSSAVRNYPWDGSNDQKAELVKLWRDKQIQYTWLRTIQNRYVGFLEGYERCTSFFSFEFKNKFKAPQRIDGSLFAT